ncbi:hypothetical protein TrVE_jg1060 [Triparma verrucosa]|uniref:Uncharacterized protein n=1 Tax=Triparma verrucosa TaxID=1606542 RepID=A0A9W7BC77_9STRA|nr:hypothetical protein TrVE_jg1060 [Triparma verrucosa]
MRKRKESAADNLREGVASLYRGLEEKNTSDQTYEKERLAVLSKLKLVPDEIVTECLGATSQFNSATAGLGLFARNRRTRKELEPKKTEKKSHKLVTLEKQNLRKRLQYSKRLNQIVKQMGVMLQDDVEIPVQLWTEYDRLQRDPGLKQRTVEDLDLGPSGRTPGPGQYAGKRDVNRKKGSIKEKGERVQITFGRSERWRDNAIKKKKDEGEEDSDEDNNDTYATRGKLGQKKGMRWGAEEREKLNELYWELGRPTRPGQKKEHYDLYAQRHRVLYKNRPKSEIIERVQYMLKFNCFKEPGESKYWKEKKKEIDQIKVKPGRTERQKLKTDEKFKTRRERLKSPFADPTSTFENGPSGIPFSSTPLDSLVRSSNASLLDGEEGTDPPNPSSLGVQLLSEDPSFHGFSFQKQGGQKANLSVDEENNKLEPTATTYRPKFDYTTERVRGGLFSDRLDSVKWTDKFAAMTGPGSYEEGGSVGRQTLSTKPNAGNATFRMEDRLKFMSSFAVS